MEQVFSLDSSFYSFSAPESLDLISTLLWHSHSCSAKTPADSQESSASAISSSSMVELFSVLSSHTTCSRLMHSNHSLSDIHLRELCSGSRQWSWKLLAAAFSCSSTWLRQKRRPNFLKETLPLQHLSSQLHTMLFFHMQLQLILSLALPLIQRLLLDCSGLFSSMVKSRTRKASISSSPSHTSEVS